MVDPIGSVRRLSLCHPKCGTPVAALVLLVVIGHRGVDLSKADRCQLVGMTTRHDEVLLHGLRAPQRRS